MKTSGIHHVTAISGHPIATLKFYRDTLGLRLVKRTVNFDDPATWHLYLGNRTGTPGSIITFFPWPRGARGRIGTGQVAVTAFAIAPAALGFWLARLASRGVQHDSPTSRFDERVIALRDPDGMLLELVATQRANEAEGWESPTGVPAEFALRGFHGITIWADGASPGTFAMLTGVLGLELAGEYSADQRTRYVSDSAIGGVVDVKRADGFWRGAGGVGTVHHVAFRAPDQAHQLAVREQLLKTDVHVTQVMERQYFESIYFREPGGVLFEVATDSPGFLIDEPEALLGTQLKLPPWLEAHRTEIANALPPLEDARVLQDLP